MQTTGTVLYLSSHAQLTGHHETGKENPKELALGGHHHVAVQQHVLAVLSILARVGQGCWVSCLGFHLGQEAELEPTYVLTQLIDITYR